MLLSFGCVIVRAVFDLRLARRLSRLAAQPPANAAAWRSVVGSSHAGTP
jgi:hypothetical protein